MKPTLIHAALILSILTALGAMLAGLIPEVAGVALLGVGKVAAAISSLSLAGHAHLARAAQNPRERVLFGFLSLAALVLLVWSIAQAWQSFTWPLWALLGVLLVLAGAAVKGASS